MKEKFNQMFKDKLFLVMLVLGLLTIVAAAGVVTIQRGNTPQEENPYMQDHQGALIAEDNVVETPTQVAGTADAQREQMQPHTENVPETEPVQLAKGPETSPVQSAQKEAAQVDSGVENAVSLVLDFSDTSKMAWPVRGNVLLDYSMDSTIYFPTLEQYQVNPGVVIQAEVSQPVAAPANAKVVAVSANEELGNFVVLDITKFPSSSFALTCLLYTSDAADD